MPIELRHYCTECLTAADDGETWAECICGGHIDLADDNFSCCMGCRICTVCNSIVVEDEQETDWCKYCDRCKKCCICNSEDFQ